MEHRITHKYSVLGLVGLAVSSYLALSTIAQAEVVGTMTALQTKIAGNNGKNLSVGAKISLGDQLSSNKTGLGMIVFDDESSAKIGPNSKLVIDEFVYQPGRSKGKVAVNMNRGLVRFYGGQISKSGKMQITTPHIVLGIRGGILDTKVGKNSTKSILRAGRMSCSVNGQTRTITKPGFACISNGKTLKVELSKDEDMDLLDSQDGVAGNGVPGRKGTGIIAKATCIEGRHDASGLCKSANGALPGLTGKSGRHRNPLQPLGSEKQEEKVFKEIIVIDPHPVYVPTHPNTPTTVPTAPTITTVPTVPTITTVPTVPTVPTAPTITTVPTIPGEGTAPAITGGGTVLPGGSVSSTGGAIMTGTGTAAVGGGITIGTATVGASSGIIAAATGGGTITVTTTAPGPSH